MLKKQRATRPCKSLNSRVDYESKLLLYDFSLPHQVAPASRWAGAARPIRSHDTSDLAWGEWRARDGLAGAGANPRRQIEGEVIDITIGQSRTNSSERNR